MNTELLLEAQLEELETIKLTRETELAAVEELSVAKGQELAVMAEEIGADEEMLFYYWDEITEESAAKDLQIEENNKDTILGFLTDQGVLLKGANGWKITPFVQWIYNTSKTEPNGLEVLKNMENDMQKGDQ